MFSSKKANYQKEDAELEQHAPFLVSNEESVSKIAPKGGSFRHYQITSKLGWTIHGLLVLFYTTVSIGMILLRYHTPTLEEIHFALPTLKTEYTWLQFPMMRDSPFIGYPSPSTEAAWHDLFGNMSLRVTDDELAENSLTSVSLPRGGNLAWLGVFHELHCIKILRKANYREHYHPNIKGEELLDLQVHVDHCIELLARTAMCRPDLETLTTFVWRRGNNKPLLNPERPLRRCINWDVLMESIEGRVVREEEMNELENPIQ